jgi:hypothetical protein
MQTKETAMRTEIKRILVFAALAIGAGQGWTGTFSTPVLVDATCRSRHWQAVCTNEVALRLNWPSGSTQAKLEIAGMNGSLATNVDSTVSNVVWRAFASDAPATEDVYDLTLTFYTNGTAVAEVQSGRVAVVKGAFGAAQVDAVAASRSWSKVKTNAVIPYDALWAADGTNAVSSQLVIAKTDGAVQTNVCTDTSGYMGWKIKNSGWSYGTFDLALSFAGTTNVWTAELTRPMDGTMVRMQ